MRAHVPLDIDLEDRLVFGLTPARLAYVVLSGLGAIAIWSSTAMAAPFRGAGALLVLGAGVLAAWGRWKARAADAWASDAARYLVSTLEIVWLP